VTADGWLSERLATAPASLARRLRGVLADPADPCDDRFEQRLRAVAERLMEEARSGPPTRETAMTLLAADACVTLACEWAAQHAPRP
jgi:hypothetical protein